MPNSNDDVALGCAFLAFCLGVGWLMFIIWAVYSLVTWVTSK